MEEIRKQTVDRIAEFFNGESINAKVDTYKKLLDFEEELKKQFYLQGVGSSENTKSLKYLDEEELFMISEVAHLYPNRYTVAQYFRDKPKVGRNENCPCGSGDKYKKCCL